MLLSHLTVPLVASAVLVCLFAKPSAAQSKSEVSRILADLYREDQADQERSDLSDDEFAKRQHERRDRVFEFVKNGLISETKDYYRAAMFFQHGEGVDDFMLAHILATIAAMEGDREGCFMSAAALDRFMTFTGQPQRFGSQTSDAEGKDLGDTSKLLSEVIVQVFRTSPPFPRSGLNGRPIDKQERTKKKLRSAGRELHKLSKTSAGKKGDALKPLVSRAVEIVDAGLLDKPDDFYNAAVVVARSEGKDERLLAHILATTAALLDHKDARRLYAQTLDAYMDSLGRSRIFRTETQPTKRPVPEPLRLHATVCAKFMGKAKKRRRR